MIKNLKPLHPGIVLHEIYMKEMNLNQFSYEIKINKLNNLKVKLFQKLKTKKKEIKKVI